MEAFRVEGEWNERPEAVAQITMLCDRCYEIARERNWRQDTQAYDRLVVDATSILARGHPRVVADIQFVGSVSNVSDTWLWAWANESFFDSVRTDVRKVRKYGDDHHFLRLASAPWKATEVDGWEMTAVVAFLLQAQGAYRSPAERGSTFMTLNDIRWAP